MATPVLVGAASLNSDVLVDSLVPDVIDGLREDLHPQFGVRAYRTYVVVRTWTGARVGEGTFTDDAGELRPQPLVWSWDTLANALRFQQAACGVRELGACKLTEVSLTYTYDQLTGGNALRDNQELFVAIADAHGQGNHPRLFTHDKPPYVDRVKDMGWVMFLRHVEAASPWVPS
jgi:hypothetical protein